MRGMAHGHGVSVHDPGHGLCIGVDIRRGNVLRGADDGQDLTGIAPRHAFEFALRHALGVADHAALGSAKRNVHGGGLPGHPRGQRFHFVQRDVGMEADTALARPARHVVLHAVAGEYLHLAVVHLGRQGDFQYALRSA